MRKGGVGVFGVECVRASVCQEEAKAKKKK
jgi:hypothetical protein